MLHWMYDSHGDNVSSRRISPQLQRPRDQFHRFYPATAKKPPWLPTSQGIHEYIFYIRYKIGKQLLQTTCATWSHTRHEKPWFWINSSPSGHSKNCRWLSLCVLQKLPLGINTPTCKSIEYSHSSGWSSANTHCWVSNISQFSRALHSDLTL